MSIQVKLVHLDVDRTMRAEHIQQAHVVFPGRVKKAEAAIKGFRMEYEDDSKNFFIQKVSLQKVETVDDVVKFELHFLLQDDNDHLENVYKGGVLVVVIAIMA